MRSSSVPAPHHRRACECFSRVSSTDPIKTALAMIFKLAETAEKGWRRLDGHHHLPKVIRGVTFTDGVEGVSRQAQAAAA